MNRRWFFQAAPKEPPVFITARLLRVGKERYLRERNWLAIDFDEPAKKKEESEEVVPPLRMWAQWWTEAGPIEPPVVVQAFPPA